MESKNIKIVDEHGIDRIANIVCSIDVDGSDYVVYWIERDNDNDNLFISKILKNNDGTSTMMNIEDSLEKSNLSEIVKELITHAINDDNDNINTDSVILKNGKNIKIANVLFNKEQNINVQKTYITTVKKSVTKVSEKYYHIEKSLENVTETIPFSNEEQVPVTPISEVTSVEMPSFESVSVLAEANPTVPVLEVPVKSEGISSVFPVVGVQSSVDVSVPVDVVVPDVSSTTKSEVSVPVESKIQSVDETNISSRINIVGATSSSVVPPVVSDSSVSSVVSEQAVSSVIPSVAPVVSVQEPPVTQVLESAKPNVSNQLFFDGSKETNLAGVFEDNSDDTKPIVVTETVAPIREFGQDDPVIPIVDDVSPAVTETGSVKSSAGFANNKFFMVIALVFFVAACVFLGYEVFKYFQMR